MAGGVNCQFYTPCNKYVSVFSHVTFINYYYYYQSCEGRHHVYMYVQGVFLAALASLDFTLVTQSQVVSESESQSAEFRI